MSSTAGNHTENADRDEKGLPTAGLGIGVWVCIGKLPLKSRYGLARCQYLPREYKVDRAFHARWEKQREERAYRKNGAARVGNASRMESKTASQTEFQ